MLLLCWLLPAASAAAKDNDRIVVVGSVLVDRAETAGDVFVIDGDVTIRGTVTGDVVVVDGDVTVRGTVSGNVVAVSGQATLGRRARVAGDLIYGDEKPIQPRLAGRRGRREGRRRQREHRRRDRRVGRARRVDVPARTAPAAAGAEGRGRRRADGAHKALACALVGLLAFFLLPVVAIAACFTLIGIPLGIVLLALLVPLLRRRLRHDGARAGRLVLKKSRILAFLAGLVVLGLLTLIPIAGGIIGFLAIVFGLGALLVSLVAARA